jgi:hypothetical protein
LNLHTTGNWYHLEYLFYSINKIVIEIVANLINYHVQIGVFVNILSDLKNVDKCYDFVDEANEF